jgi:two-component system, sensor histidine kinase
MPDINAGRPLKVVVVDDESDFVEMFAELLRLRGHAVRLATESIAALELLAVERPDVLFLDLGLPELDGYELAREVRHRFGDDIRVVAVTGYNTAQARGLADWAGFDAFISKPVRAHDIDKSLRPQMDSNEH